MNLTTYVLRKCEKLENALPGIAVVVILGTMVAACSGNKKEREDQKLNNWHTTLADLKTYLSNLKIEREQLQSYIESAEVHQVLRSQQEKERQLNNLNLYKSEIDIKIDSIEKLVINFSDSIKVLK